MKGQLITSRPRKVAHWRGDSPIWRVISDLCPLYGHQLLRAARYGRPAYLARPHRDALGRGPRRFWIITCGLPGRTGAVAVRTIEFMRAIRRPFMWDKLLT